MTKIQEKITLPNYKKPAPYGGNAWDWALFFVSPFRWQLGFYFVVNVARQSFFQSQPLLFGILVGLFESGRAQSDPSSLIWWFAIYIALSLLVYSLIIILIPSGLIMDLISKHISLFGFRHYISLSEGWHENRASGEKLQKLITARQSAFTFTINAFWRLCPVPAMVVAIVATMITLDVSIIYMFLFVGMTFTYVACCFITGQWMIKRYAHYYATQENVVGRVYEFLLSTATMRYFNLKNHAVAKAEELEVANHKARGDNLRTSFKRWLTLDTSVLIWIIPILMMACYDMLYNGMSIAAFTAIIFFTLRVWGELEPLAMSYTEMLENWEGFKRLTSVFNEKPEIEDKADAKPLQNPKPEIVFDKARFHYQEGKRVIDNFSLHIKNGEKIGLIGPSGAGKSTIVKLLMRFYDVEDGTIRIGGQDIRDVQRASLQENIAVIPQDVVLFNHPLIENIRYGNLAASDEDVYEAARLAHAEEFIKGLPDGYNTIVGERGVKLSGGQRQRVGIARAILKSAPILILDEATSALDSESEKYIQESLKDLMKDKTVIAIAHRLSTISSLDRLIIMDEGKIVEEGNHDSLLKQNGLYARLWSMQSGGFLQE